MMALGFYARLFVHRVFLALLNAETERLTPGVAAQAAVATYTFGSCEFVALIVTHDIPLVDWTSQTPYISHFLLAL